LAETDQTNLVPTCADTKRFTGPEFSAGIIDLELPVDATLLRVRFLRPDADFDLQKFQVADPATA
jgi:hypothetical protein